MTYVRYAFLILVLLIAVTVALANRAMVTLSLWPDTVSAIIGTSYSMTLPLFVVVGGAVGLGLVLGLVWEWLRERGYRAEAARSRRELERLRAHRTPAASSAPAPAAKPRRDDVLAILEDPATR
ncbi:MAG: Protein of unknown function (DUF1049) [Rhodobacteraceae bacterium HLUCCA12]|nr:MAG: Protein of unknown function (DUF1049) [Rhodobacteraceae bacterium HLUCCA12]